MSIRPGALKTRGAGSARRAGLALTSLAMVITLPACSSQDAVPTAIAPTSASPTALTAAELAELRRLELLAWASDVCRARSQVRSAVLDLPASLLVLPSAGTSVEDQLQSQIDAGLDEITVAMASLGSALGQAPIDYQEASDIAVEINSKGDSFTLSRRAAEDSLRAVSEAGNPIEAGLALADASVRVKEAFDSGVDFLQTVEDVTRPLRGELGEAFDQAPGCNDDR